MTLQVHWCVEGDRSACCKSRVNQCCGRASAERIGGRGVDPLQRVANAESKPTQIAKPKPGCKRHRNRRANKIRSRSRIIKLSYEEIVWLAESEIDAKAEAEAKSAVDDETKQRRKRNQSPAETDSETEIETKQKPRSQPKPSPTQIQKPELTQIGERLGH